jgi:hypothetical protein
LRLGLAFGLACRASEGGATFTPPDIRKVPAAAVEAKGSEKCDVAYHVDGQRYQLGGCNREYVGEWSKRDGTPSAIGMAGWGWNVGSVGISTAGTPFVRFKI